MSKPTRAVPILLAILAAIPATASAQIGVGAHVGTTGFGGDIALALGKRAQVRGSVAIMPIEPSRTISNIEVTVKMPSSITFAGIDLFPTGSGFRIGGGVLLKPDDPVLRGELDGPQTIGDQTYTPEQVGKLTATSGSGSASVADRSAACRMRRGFPWHGRCGRGPAREDSRTREEP